MPVYESMCATVGAKLTQESIVPVQAAETWPPQFALKRLEAQPAQVQSLHDCTRTLPLPPRQVLGQYVVGAGVGVRVVGV